MRNTILLLALLLFTGNIEAQNKTDKKTKITIINEEDGKKTVIDTTFINADQEAIDAFLQAQGMNRTLPPIPPTPPAPPTPGKMKHGVPVVPPVPPVPPAPPTPDDESSFYFHFNMPDIDIDLDIEKELEKAQEALEKARESMDRQLSKEKLEEMREDLQRNLKELEKEIEKAGKTKKIIIRSKTGNVDTDTENSTGYIYNYSSPGYSYSYSMPEYSYSYGVSACSGDEPLVITRGNSNDNVVLRGNGYNYAYSYPCVVVNHKSKVRQLVDKVVNWILE